MAAAAEIQAIIFVPHGNIAYGKLAQALEYGAVTLQVEANFDQILALVRKLAEETGIYLLNSINPFRIEGPKDDRHRKCSISEDGRFPTGSCCRVETSAMYPLWASPCAS